MGSSCAPQVVLPYSDAPGMPVSVVWLHLALGSKVAQLSLTSGYVNVFLDIMEPRCPHMALHENSPQSAMFVFF